MKLFLSYPSTERALADRLVLALEAEGHEVFFDRADLAAGESFHQRLREAIQSAQAMVFLVTPASVATGSYTLAELDIARARWRKPAGCLLPVMVEATPISAFPPYLSAVTVLQPRGELVAETVAAVARLEGGPDGRSRRRVLVGLLALILMIGAGIGGWQWMKHRAIEEALQRDTVAAGQAIKLCIDGSHQVALLQLTELASHQPAAAKAQAYSEDCAMRWMREMRAVSGDKVKLTFDEQVAIAQRPLLQGLGSAKGQRAADLRSHIGWGEQLRRREGSGTVDPTAHWKRALGDDPANVYAHAMWGHILLPGHVSEARLHFSRALASNRDRDFVRRLQMGGALGNSDAANAYAVEVANEMRRGGETLAEASRRRLWSYVFSSGLMDDNLKKLLFAAASPGELLATLEWLIPASELNAPSNLSGRFSLAALQANAGRRDEARAGFESLLQTLRAERQSGRLMAQTQAALAALGRQP